MIAALRSRLERACMQAAAIDPDGPDIEHHNHTILELANQLGAAMLAKSYQGAAEERCIVIAALFVERGGVYWDLPGVDAWDRERDARNYAGPHPVVAHPPCERWGRYWSGGPSAKVRRAKGDDGGCFEFALGAVREHGGVLEHPEASHAWAAFGLLKPPRGCGWVFAGDGLGHTCCVEQGNYGHPARKATWLYYVGEGPPPELIWGPSSGRRLDEGFHSKAERDAARAAGRKPVPRLSRAQNLATPIPFRDLLLSIARSSRRSMNNKGSDDDSSR